MGLSSSKTTTTSGPSAQALPYLTSGSSALQSTYDANKGNLSEIGGGLADAFKAYSANNGADLSPVRSYATGVLNSDPASNPALGGIIDQTNNDVMDRVNALFSKAGQTGSSRQEGELGKQLANNETNLRYTDYNTQLAQKQAAAQNLLGVNAGTNANAATEAALGTTAAQVPYIGANYLAQGLGGLWGNSQTQTQTSSPSILGSLLQAGSSAAGAFAASDRRLKTNIEKKGELPDGLGIYEFDYLPATGEIAKHMRDGRQTGVMADEVARLRPWALGPEVDGYTTVRYEVL